MIDFKRMICNHDYSKAHGWSYMKCSKCEKIVYNPEKACKYWNDFGQRYYSDTPELKDQFMFGLKKRYDRF